jgi:hypothetical protein
MDSSRRRRASRLHALTLVVCAVLALGALIAPLAGAAWTAPAPIAGSLTDGSTSAVDVKADRAGNAFAAWAEAGSFPSSVIKVATKPAGGAWSAPTPLVAEVTPGTPIQGTAPKLTLAPDGTATVVWQDSGYPGTGIWAATRAPGAGWSTPSNVSAGAAGPFGTPGPRAVTDATGTTTVLWQSGINMRAATRAIGGSWGAPVDVYLGTDGDTNNLAGIGADVAADGAVTVVFRVGTTGNMGLYSKTRATPDSAWGSIETIIGRGNRVGDPQLAISKAGSSTGEATAFWYDDNVGGVKIASRDTTGNWTTPASLSLGDSNAYNQKVAYDAHGNAVAVWQSLTGIQSQRRVAGSWSEAALIPGAADGATPQLTTGADGSIVAAWIATSDVNSVVFTSRYESGSWSATPTIISDAGVDAAATGLRVGPTGDVEAVWAAAGDTLRTATDQRLPAQAIDWTANGLTGTFNLRSWIRYLGGNAGVELSAGASRPDVNDQYSFHFSSTDAWRQQETGETVVAGEGTVRFSFPAHFIDNRIINPEFRIAADGLTGKVVADGQGSGDRAEAQNGNPSFAPYTDVHLLDLDVAAGTKVVSADGTRTTWVGVPATITAAAAPYLSYEAGTPYGSFTITAPTSLPERSLPPVIKDPPPPPVQPGPGPTPQPQPETPKPKPPVKTPVVVKVTGKAGKVSAKGAVTVTVSKRLGAKATKSYRVVVVRNGKTIATGTVRGKTLTLSIRKVGMGKKAKYPKLAGKYSVKGGKGVKGVTTIQLTVR